MAPRNRLRTDLAVVREVLQQLETRTQYAVSLRTGINAATIRSWRLRAMREATGWPTDQDITDWRAESRQNAAHRARETARTKAIRVYTLRTGHGRRMPNTGTVRRLQALVALGWSQGDLAEHLGVCQQYVSLLMSGRHSVVFVSTHATICALYDDLSMRLPTHRDPKQIARTRAIAARRGYFPPLAWNDEDLDRPDARPYPSEAA